MNIRKELAITQIRAKVLEVMFLIDKTKSDNKKETIQQLESILKV